LGRKNRKNALYKYITLYFTLEALSAERKPKVFRPSVHSEYHIPFQGRISS